MTHWGPMVVALLLAGCCFDGLTPPATPIPLPPPTSPGSGTGPLLPGGSIGGTGTPLSFGVGTTDPVITQGFGGGPIMGTTFDPGCYAGHYPTSPSHVLTLTEPLAYVRVMAYSSRSTDLTLLVRLPNGVVMCNDDSDGLNPMVELTAPSPGEYQVYVGTFSAPGPEPYELGISTQYTATPTTMHFTPTTVVSGTAASVGALLLSGTATVTSITGSVPSVYVGSACTYSQSRMLPTGGPGVLDCRWQVTCSGTDVYGGTMTGGYQPCSDPSWPGALAMDSATTANDGDPTFLFSEPTMTIGDDATGRYGAFTVILDAAPPSRVPTPPLPIAPFPQAAS